MSAATYIVVTIEPCGTKHTLMFRRTDAPGALVEVEINGEKTIVKPHALLLAIKAIAEAEA